MILCHCQAEQYLRALEVYYTFFVTCFKSSSVLLSLSYHTNTGAFVIQKGSSSEATTRLPLGNPMHDYVIALEIQIIDSLGAARMEVLIVSVCNQHQFTSSNIHCLGGQASYFDLLAKFLWLVLGLQIVVSRIFFRRTRGQAWSVMPEAFVFLRKKWKVYETYLFLL